LKNGGYNFERKMIAFLLKKYGQNLPIFGVKKKGAKNAPVFVTKRLFRTKLKKLRLYDEIVRFFLRGN